MKNVAKGAVAVAALATAQKTAQKVARKILAGDEGPHRGEGTDRWHAATVDLPPERVSDGGGAPPPLRDLAGIEVRMQQAPGGRGTEIYVRSTGGSDSPDVGTVRKALREAKSLLETGDVLLPDHPPTTQPTPLNKPTRTATEHARGEGRL
jgi:hypothetical protein